MIYSVIAMSQHRLGQPDEARNTLEGARTILDGRYPPAADGSSALEAFEPGWMNAQILYREAVETLAAPPPRRRRLTPELGGPWRRVDGGGIRTSPWGAVVPAANGPKGGLPKRAFSPRARPSRHIWRMPHFPHGAPSRRRCEVRFPQHLEFSERAPPMQISPANLRGESPLAHFADALRSIDACSGCQGALGLAPPSFAAPASAWLCGGCGSGYFARLAGPQRLKNTRPVHFEQIFQAANFRPSAAWRAPLPELRRVLQFLATFEHGGHEKRRKRRHPVALPVLALPLGHDFRVVGAALQMTMVNISPGGALIDAEPCRAPYLAVDFPIARLHIQAILEILRVRPLRRRPRNRRPLALPHPAARAALISRSRASPRF